MRKATLLRSVSAIATAAASVGGAHQALAQDAGSDGYYYNVQGGLLFSPAESYLADIEDKIGSGSAGSGSGYSGTAVYTSSGAEFADLFGGNASVSFGKQFDPNWDVRGTLSATQFGSTSASYSAFWGASGFYESGASTDNSAWASAYYEENSEASYSFGWQALDLEVGYSPVLSDNFSVRLFAGIRGLHFEENSEYGWNSAIGFSAYAYSGNAYSGFSGIISENWEGSMKTEFFGIGPRIGAQTSKRFEGTNFGLSASVAGAMLFGTQKTTWQGSGGWYSGFSAYYGSGASGVSTGNPSGGSTYAVSGSSFSGSSYSSSIEVDKTVIDIQAQIGLDYYLDDANKLTVGVQGEKLFNVGPYDDDEVTRSSAGFFIGLTGSF
jgi:hypothetical protein